MLHHGHQLDVRVAHVGRIRHQRVGQLAVRQAAAIGVPPPRPEMHLVDRHRPVQPPAGRRARRHPGGVAPGVAVVGPDERCRPRRRLGRTRERVGLLQQVAFRRAHLVLVAGAVAEAGHEQLPDPRRHQAAHRVHAPVPLVEIAHHADALGIRRPHGEVHAGHVADGQPARAQLLPGAVVRALGEEMQVEIGQHRPELVGIDQVADRGSLVDAQPVGQFVRRGGPRQRGLEHAAVQSPRHGDGPAVGHQLNRRGVRLDGAHDHRRDAAVYRGVPAQYAEWVGTCARRQRIELARVGCGGPTTHQWHCNDLTY